MATSDALVSARATVRWSSGANAVAGVWLFIAPFMLGYVNLQPAFWNDLVVGAAVFFLALARARVPLRNIGISWANVVIGLWLVLAPFLLQYQQYPAVANADAAVSNDVILGIIVALLAARSATAARGARKRLDAEGKRPPPP